MASSTAFDTRPGRPTINADLRDVAQRVRQEFAGRLDPRDVDECLARVAARFYDATVRAFIPLLVARYARDELDERARERATGFRPKSRR